MTNDLVYGKANKRTIYLSIYLQLSLFGMNGLHWFFLFVDFFIFAESCATIRSDSTSETTQQVVVDKCYKMLTVIKWLIYYSTAYT